MAIDVARTFTLRLRGPFACLLFERDERISTGDSVKDILGRCDDGDGDGDGRQTFGANEYFDQLRVLPICCLAV